MELARFALPLLRAQWVRRCNPSPPDLQRFHLLWPKNETFVEEIERSIVNVALAALGDVGSGGEGPNGTGIRYFANQHKVKQFPSMHASCCEGQGTRLFGSLPLFLWAVSPPSSATLNVSVDIYAAGVLNLTMPTTCGGGVGLLAVSSLWPYNSNVVLDIVLSATCAEFAVSLRIPAWVASTAVTITVNGTTWPAVGVPASYVDVTLEWPAGTTTLALFLPMGLTSARYMGSTQKDPYTRWSLLYGPTLMSFQGPWAATPIDCIVMPTGINPADPGSWLVPARDGNSLHWNVTGGSGVTVKPYFEVQADSEIFTNYPCFP